MMMAKELIAFHSRTDENYFGGSYRHIDVGNTEVAANNLRETTGADLLKIEQAKPYSKEYSASRRPRRTREGTPVQS